VIVFRFLQILYWIAYIVLFSA